MDTSNSIFSNNTFIPTFEQVQETVEQNPIAFTAFAGIAFAALTLTNYKDVLCEKFYDFKFKYWVFSLGNIVGKQKTQMLLHAGKDLFCEKITYREFEEKFSSINIEAQSPAYPFLMNLKNHFCERRPVWIWDGNLRAKEPRDSQTSAYAQEYRVLMIRLKELFPDTFFAFDKYHPDYDKDALEKMKTPFNWDNIEKLCFDLLDCSIKIAEAACRDLEHWNKTGEVKDYDGEPLKEAELLTKQRNETGGTYLYRAFFHFPEAYRLIANLKTPGIAEELFANPDYRRNYPEALAAFKANAARVPENWNQRFFMEGTKESTYLKRYHDYAERIVQLAGGKAKLDTADQRFTPWISKHEKGVPFITKPYGRPN